MRKHGVHRVLDPWDECLLQTIWRALVSVRRLVDRVGAEDEQAAVQQLGGVGKAVVGRVAQAVERKVDVC